jgi:TatA/E family protein of Tat protein translocase
MIYGLGMQELLVILAIVMLLFGGKKLPEVGRNLGKAIRGFKQAEEETTKEIQEAARSAKTAETPEPDEAASAGEPSVEETEGEPEGEAEPAATGEEEAEKPA